MFRLKALGLLGLMWATASPYGFSQTSRAQGSDRRLEDALAEIATLKRQVKEQDRRIADLEKAVKSLPPAASAPPEKPAERPKVIAKLPAALWHNPFAWVQIKEGMSRAQVEEILGKPTSVEAVIDYQTLIYKGDVPGIGMLSGSVKLTDDRVTQVSPPDL